METLGITHSACATCRALVPARVVTDGRRVCFRKFCPEHGESESLVSSDVAGYLRAHRYVKPAWVPREFAGDAGARCPEGCGFCSRHEQHLCLPIVEVTTRCDLSCPICIADAGGDWDMSSEEFRNLLDRLIRAERQVDVLNLSGGEPLLHPRLLALVDEALSRPQIVRVSISTNGLKLLSEPRLAAAFRQRDVVVSLQFDGFDEEAYVQLRGRPLLDEKRRVLSLLQEEGVATSLTMTAAGGVNDGQFRPMLDYLFSHDHVISMMVQPLAFAGRAERLARTVPRLGIPDVVRALDEAGHPAVRAEDFVSVPCSHPLCMCLAFYVAPQGGCPVAVNRLVGAEQMLDAMRNRVLFGLDAADQERVRQCCYDLWSGPVASAPDSEAAMQAIRSVLREVSQTSFDARKAFSAAQRRIKSIFIHAFQDADTFDLARVRRCCNAYPLADGRLVPACVYNVMGRRRCGNSSANTARRS